MSAIIFQSRSPHLTLFIITRMRTYFRPLVLKKKLILLELRLLFNSSTKTCMATFVHPYTKNRSEEQVCTYLKIRIEPRGMRMRMNCGRASYAY